MSETRARIGEKLANRMSQKSAGKPGAAMELDVKERRLRRVRDHDDPG